MFVFSKNRRKKMPRGFSLVELLVSVFIFSVVMTISVGSLLVLIDANEKGQGIQTVMSNLSFALDSMTRDIRTGRDYYCDTDWDTWDDGDAFPSDDSANPANDCSDPNDLGRVIVFTNNRTGDRVAFRHNPDLGGVGVIERKIDTYDSNGNFDEAGEWLRLTSSDLSVSDFAVSVNGTDEGDDVQPTVRIFIEGYITRDPDTDPDFQLQTDITQRTINL